MSDNIAASAKVLFTREQIEERAAQLGKQISDDYAGESLYLIGTLRGAVVWIGGSDEEYHKRYGDRLYSGFQLRFGNHFNRSCEHKKRS